MGSRSKARARAKANQQARRASAAPRAGQAGGGSGSRHPGQQNGGSGSRATGHQDAGSRGRAARQSGPAVPAAASQPTGPARAGTDLQQPAVAPRTVLAASAVQAAEALGVLIASAMAAVDTASGRSYHLASGIAITIIGVGMAALLGLVALGLRGVRRWSRTPAVLTQLFVAIVAIYLLQAHRYDWGIPAILLGAGGFAALLAPASLRVLTPGRPEESDQKSKSNAVK